MINCIITLSKFTADSLACGSWFHSHFSDAMTQFIISKRTDAENWQFVVVAFHSLTVVLWHDMYCCLLGLVGTQGPVSSVLIQKHSSEQATSGAPPSRHPYGQRAPPTRTINTRTSRGPTVQTIHTTPVKVVHWLPSIIYPSFTCSQLLLVIENDSIFYSKCYCTCLYSWSNKDTSQCKTPLITGRLFLLSYLIPQLYSIKYFSSYRRSGTYAFSRRSQSLGIYNQR